jgi:[ribosomal protein S18]-alanine N-acetyltransferase
MARMTDQQINVRRAAGEADASSCASIMAATDPWKRLGRGYDDTFRLVTDPQVEVSVAVTPEEEVVGLVIIRMIPVFKGYISAIAVHENWRGRGIGTMLLEYAEQRIFRESPNVFLCCSSFNHDAMRLYLRLGYQKIGEMKDFIAAGSGEVLMRKTIGPISTFKPMTGRSGR